MKKLKYILILIVAILYAELGCFLLYCDIYKDYRFFLVYVILYIILGYSFYKCDLFQVHILPRIRGYILSIKLKSTGKHLMIGKNVKVLHPDRVSFDDNCDIGEGTIFAPLCNSGGRQFPSEIKVGKNVHFGTQDRIASMNSVVIEDDVLFAAFVHVTDHSHEYRKVGLPVRKQSVYTKGPVVIKKGAWLAFGCHVLSGVTVGEFSVVAANAVVTRNVPPYSVVAGNPASVVSKYNFVTKQWDKTKS